MAAWGPDQDVLFKEGEEKEEAGELFGGSATKITEHGVLEGRKDTNEEEADITTTSIRKKIGRQPLGSLGCFIMCCSLFVVVP